MFEKLFEIGEAFKSFGNSNIDTDIEELVDPLDEKISERLRETDDELADLSTKEVMKREKEVFDVKRENKEDDLDKKLANIEKVIGAFSEAPEQVDIPKQDMGSASDNINVKPLDMGNVQAKEVINEYLKPSVNADRVGLLYENLRKLNLI
jgi:hypothetical protein